MCIKPVVISEGVVVGCRKCWQCRANRVDTWVGRNIAEADTASVSYAVTLTYGRDKDGRSDYINSVQLMYSDIQKFLKRLRKKGYIVRYIVAGEYGSQMQRAHWHGVFHFYGDVLPEWDGVHLSWSQDKWDSVGGIHIPEWSLEKTGPIGFVHIKKATFAHVRYALKYLLKDQQDDNGQALFHMSRKPPLGYKFFMERAADVARSGLPLLDCKYTFKIRTISGVEQNKAFMLQGRLAELYVAEYIRQWSLHNAGPRPISEMVDVFEEWGRLGDEDRLTAASVEKLPKDTSIFTSDGYVRAELPQKRTLQEWFAYRDQVWKNERRLQRSKEFRRSGEEAKRLRRAERDARRANIERVCQRIGITFDEFCRYTASEQRFCLRYPEDFESLLDARRRDFEAYRARKPSGFD